MSNLGRGNKFHLDKISELLVETNKHLDDAEKAAHCPTAARDLVEAAKTYGEIMGHADSTTSESRRDSEVADQIHALNMRLQRVKMDVIDRKCKTWETPAPGRMKGTHDKG
jgi:hypothetical protein